MLSSSLLLTHCLMIGNMFSEILNGYNYVLQVTWSTYIHKHSRLNINDSGEVREGDLGCGGVGESKQAHTVQNQGT